MRGLSLIAYPINVGEKVKNLEDRNHLTGATLQQLLTNLSLILVSHFLSTSTKSRIFKGILLISTVSVDNYGDKPLLEHQKLLFMRLLINCSKDDRDFLLIKINDLTVSALSACQANSYAIPNVHNQRFLKKSIL